MDRHTRRRSNMTQYMLLLHQVPAYNMDLPREKMLEMTKRYMAWADGLRQNGKLAGGEKLAAGGVRHITVKDGKPEAWLAVVARNRALDQIRHEARGVAIAGDLLPFEPPVAECEGHFDRELSDDELALLFAVCHPVLSLDLRVTFALKSVCGLTVQ